MRGFWSIQMGMPRSKAVEPKRRGRPSAELFRVSSVVALQRQDGYGVNAVVRSSHSNSQFPHCIRPSTALPPCASQCLVSPTGLQFPSPNRPSNSTHRQNWTTSTTTRLIRSLRHLLRLLMIICLTFQQNTAFYYLLAVIYQNGNDLVIHHQQNSNAYNMKNTLA
jgi:hypothetical protein